MPDAALALDKAEAVAAGECNQMLQVSLRGRSLARCRTGEDGVDVEQSPLLHLGDPDQEPRLASFALASLKDLTVEVAPTCARAFIPSCSCPRPDPTAKLARMLVRPELRAAMLVPLHSALNPRRGDSADQDARFPNPARNLIGVAVQIREELLALIAGPKRGVARTGAPATPRRGWGMRRPQWRQRPAAAPAPSGHVDKTPGPFGLGPGRPSARSLRGSSPSPSARKCST